MRRRRAHRHICRHARREGPQRLTGAGGQERHESVQHGRPQRARPAGAGGNGTVAAERFFTGTPARDRSRETNRPPHSSDRSVLPNFRRVSPGYRRTLICRLRQSEEWRKRMGIEPTVRCWRTAGFEDQEGHQTPFASTTGVTGRRRTGQGPGHRQAGVAAGQRAKVAGRGRGRGSGAAGQGSRSSGARVRPTEVPVRADMSAASRQAITRTASSASVWSTGVRAIAPATAR